MHNGTERRRLTLPHYPPITIGVTTNGETATYRLLGRRLYGALEITPCFDDDTEALPSRACIHLGLTGPIWTPDQHRAELLTINGVALYGPHLINPVRHILNPRPWLNPSRTGGGQPSEPTRRYYTKPSPQS